MEHYASGDEVVLINSIEKEEDNAEESDTVQQIKKTLETRVRPVQLWMVEIFNLRVLKALLHC